MMQSPAGVPWLVVDGVPAPLLLSVAATKLVTKNTTAMTAIKKSTSRDLPVVLMQHVSREWFVCFSVMIFKVPSRY